MNRAAKYRLGSLARMAALAGNLGQLSQRQAETSSAAARTISYRTNKMIRAFGDPVAMSHPEFMRMGTEKLEAAAEAGHAMASGLAGLSSGWLRLWQHQMQFGQLLMQEFSTKPQDINRFWTLPYWFGPQGRSLSRNMDLQWRETLNLGAQMTRMLGAGLTPYHQRTHANAGRLGRRTG